MIIELKDLLTIDDKEYVVKEILNVDNTTYYCLFNIDDILDFKFCYLRNNDLYEEFNKETIFKLISCINKNNLRTNIVS